MWRIVSEKNVSKNFIIWKLTVVSKILNLLFVQKLVICKTYTWTFDEIYVPLETNGVHTRSSYEKLNVPHRKTNVGQKALSYFDPSLWNNLTKTLKTSTSLNAFKLDVKQHYFNELKKRESSKKFLYFCFKVIIFIWI